MAKGTQDDMTAVLDALKSMVMDHGDRFSFSISKRGRVWMTFTHWDQRKYNTSVELDDSATVGDVIGGLAVLVIAHAGKCLGNVVKDDSWTDVEATRSQASAAVAMMTREGWTLAVRNVPAEPGDGSDDQQEAAGR